MGEAHILSQSQNRQFSTLYQASRVPDDDGVASESRPFPVKALVIEKADAVVDTVRTKVARTFMVESLRAA
jgi:hypothetical protein